MFEISFETDGFRENLINLERKSKSGGKVAKLKTGLALLSNVITGSKKLALVPPIKTGMLRGSGSVFVGNEFVAGAGDLFSGLNNSFINRSGSGTNNENTITIGFNVPYAGKMHETEWKPGPTSEQSGNVGNKFIEKHLQADGPDLMKFYAEILKKEVGM